METGQTILQDDDQFLNNSSLILIDLNRLNLLVDHLIRRRYSSSDI